jgi:hypothetical protein
MAYSLQLTAFLKVISCVLFYEVCLRVIAKMTLTLLIPALLKTQYEPMY